jgi:predicted phosphodiesterase
MPEIHEDALVGPVKLRRFGILGDIHAEHETLAVVLEYLSRQDLDAVLSVGDIVDGTGDVNVCCRLLTECKAVVVRGNHERWFLEGKMRDLPEATRDGEVDAVTRAFLGSLPSTRRMATIRGDLLLCHGTGDDDMTALRPEDSGYAFEVNDPLQSLVRADDVKLLVCGHSHRRMVRQIGPLTIVNAGTLSRYNEPGFGIVDLDDEAQVTFFECIADRVIVTTDVVGLSLSRS